MARSGGNRSGKRSGKGGSFNPWDPYARQAKQEDYAARSVYKLKEIQAKHHLIRKGDRVLDLGACPGSWSQYAAELVGETGQVAGIDLNPVAVPIPGYIFIQADLYELAWVDALRERGFALPVRVVLSDMAPKTTGVRVTDQARSVGLAELALHVASQALMPGGHLVCKLFDSGDTPDYLAQCRTHFEKVQVQRPKSTRQASKEIFVVALNFRPTQSVSPTPNPEL